ncbi:MAG: zinc ribbon domain-containing protein [Oscillospiraceae bacterium]
MFLIAGSSAKAEATGYLETPCPICGCTRPLHLGRRYQYIHLFFLPLYKYDIHTFATCPDCASVFELPSQPKGREAPDGSGLRLVQNHHRKICPGCGKAADSDDAFCRGCGRKL